MQSEPVEAHGFGNECKKGLMQHNVAFASERYQQHWLLFIFRPPEKVWLPIPCYLGKPNRPQAKTWSFGVRA